MDHIKNKTICLISNGTTTQMNWKGVYTLGSTTSKGIYVSLTSLGGLMINSSIDFESVALSNDPWLYYNEDTFMRNDSIDEIIKNIETKFVDEMGCHGSYQSIDSEELRKIIADPDYIDREDDYQRASHVDDQRMFCIANVYKDKKHEIDTADLILFEYYSQNLGVIYIFY